MMVPCLPFYTEGNLTPKNSIITPYFIDFVRVVEDIFERVNKYGCQNPATL